MKVERGDEVEKMAYSGLAATGLLWCWGTFAVSEVSAVLPSTILYAGLIVGSSAFVAGSVLLVRCFRSKRW